jgi:hypothetical protein
MEYVGSKNEHSGQRSVAVVARVSNHKSAAAVQEPVHERDCLDSPVVDFPLGVGIFPVGRNDCQNQPAQYVNPRCHLMYRMQQLTKTLLAGGGLALAGWVGWGLYTSRTAQSVPYEHLRTIDGLEIRRYPPTVLAETTAPNQRTAFRRLFNYISGTNRGDESISMTAPVETQHGETISMTSPVRSEAAESGGGDVQMAFYLPSEYGPENAPEPTESSVTLVTEPQKTVAIDRFSWYAPTWRVSRRTRRVQSTLADHGIESVGDPSLLRYNDPWTPPFMRRNEVAVEIAPDD